MIHVAPCSCELHVRIRELEAELADEEDTVKRVRARAEKAEARVAELADEVSHLEGVIAEAREREDD